MYTGDVHDVRAMYPMYGRCTRCTGDVRDVPAMYARQSHDYLTLTWHCQLFFLTFVTFFKATVATASAFDLRYTDRLSYVGARMDNYPPISSSLTFKGESYPYSVFFGEQTPSETRADIGDLLKPYFAQVAKRIMTLDKSVLENLTNRMMKGERVKPETEAEVACFKVLSDIDAVGGHVKGSLTSKKYMRNNVWSLISYTGAPSWFVTLSPADINHPICIYFADKNITFKPELYFKKADEAYRLVTSNPVAAARFF